MALNLHKLNILVLTMILFPRLLYNKLCMAILWLWLWLCSAELLLVVDEYIAGLRKGRQE
jgi:hypothetical protein